MQKPWFDAKIKDASVVPTLARNARMGHPAVGRVYESAIDHC